MTVAARIFPGTPSPYAVPPDLQAACEGWGANCGPAALAALLGMTMTQVRPHLVGFEQRRYVNPTHMKQALASIGAGFHLPAAADRWPVTGLCFIQWDGPWNWGPKARVVEAYRHTHWICVRCDWVFDVNAEEWAPRWWWEQEIAPALIKAHKHAAGWNVRSGYEVQVNEARPA